MMDSFRMHNTEQVTNIRVRVIRVEYTHMQRIESTGRDTIVRRT